MLVDKGVLGGVETWKNTDRLADKCDHSYTRKAIVTSMRIMEE